MSKRHVHMLDLDSPSHPRLRKSSCKKCVEREAEVERLRKNSLVAACDKRAAEVERLRDNDLRTAWYKAENERLREENEELRHIWGEQEAVALHAEVERLREALEEIRDNGDNFDTVVFARRALEEE